MPNKDPDVRREYNRAYQRERARRLKKQAPSGICSNYPSCSKPTDGVHKKCAYHRQYMREYKKEYRAAPKPAGSCSVTDCMRLVEDAAFKMCARCRQRAAAQQRVSSSYNPRHKAMRDANKARVVEAYGGACVCCGERQVEFLSIDHVDGSGREHLLPRGRKRSGAHLYAWLVREGFPKDRFRLLCMSCNAALGHHGYCPHGNLRQNSVIGRPRVRPLPSNYDAVRAKRRSYMIEAYKKPALQAYGGPVCACCGEDHLECLTIDHTRGTGAAHRREQPEAKNLYIWLKKNGYPPGFRVLCMNCNFSLGRFGYCPHGLKMDAKTS